MHIKKYWNKNSIFYGMPGNIYKTSSRLAFSDMRTFEQKGEQLFPLAQIARQRSSIPCAKMHPRLWQAWNHRVTQQKDVLSGWQRWEGELPKKLQLWRDAKDKTLQAAWQLRTTLKDPANQGPPVLLIDFIRATCARFDFNRVKRREVGRNNFPQSKFGYRFPPQSE